jgi:hypothetical protein
MYRNGCVIGLSDGNMISAITTEVGGQLEITGAMLNEFYNYSATQELISMGNLEKLATSIDKSVFLRNTIEGSTHTVIFNSLKSFMDHYQKLRYDYMYLYRSSLWWVHHPFLPFSELWVPIPMALESLYDDES